MTMPNERFYAIRNTREFLVELMDPKKTPRVPKEIRLKAYYAIKHFQASIIWKRHENLHQKYLVIGIQVLTYEIRGRINEPY